MTQETDGFDPDYIAMAGDIVVAYVANNPVPPTELPALIASVHAAVIGLSSDQAAAGSEPKVDKPSPAQIRKSVQRDGIVSFIDGKTYKTLKRHLTTHGLDPASYRARYGLPADYPLVASAYSEERSKLARAAGLGVPGARLGDTPKDRKNTA